MRESLPGLRGARQIMKYGVVIFATDYSIRADELAKATGQRGFESIFFPEHTHIPTSRRTPYPLGGELPREYSHTIDPIVAMTMAASATQNLKVATGVCLVIERDPIVLAKEVASVDQASNGRVIFGIGGGWNAEEMENHGTTVKSRWKLLRERVEAMKALWTQDEASYHGERGMQRVIRYCDGWMPNAGPGSNFPGQIAKLRQLAEEAGRDPRTIAITAFAAPPDRKTLDQYEASGAERAVLFLPPAEADTVMPLLDQYAKLI